MVDNLDRLPPEQALQTWATMRTFFANGTTRDDWENRFWLLVPINFDALNGVFGDGDDLDDTSDSEEEPDSKKEPDSNGGPLVDPAQEAVHAFADKTFHTVFHVAPPVLSDWETFMKDQLRAAFPEQMQSGDPIERDYHAVYRVYRTQGIRGNQIPTPRDIKIFINRLSALYRQWGNDMSLKTLAAFELMRNQISPNGHEITHGTLLPDRLASELTPLDWKKSFASLHFNVDPARSIQVLIGEEVQTALENGDPAPLADVQEVDGFDAVLDQVVQEIAEEGTEREVSHAAVVLDEVAITTPNVRTRVRKLLRGRVANTSGWYPSTSREGNGLVHILRHAPDAERDALATHILTMVSSVDINASSSNQRRKQVAGWVRGVVPLVRCALASDPSPPPVSVEKLLGIFHAPEGAAAYIDVARALSAEANADDLMRFITPHPDDPANELDTAMQEIVEDGDFDEEALAGLTLMRHVPTAAFTWTATTEAFFNRISWNASLKGDDLRVHLEGALVLGAVFDETQVAKVFGTNQNGRALVSHHLHQNRIIPDIAALCVLLRLIYSASQNRGSNKGNAQAGHNFFVQLLKSPSEHESIVAAVTKVIARLDIVWPLLRAAHQHNNTTSFLKHIVAKLADRSDSAQHLTANVVCAFPNLIHENLTHEQSRQIFRDADEYDAVLELLRGLTKDEWLNHLKKETDHLHIVAALSSKDDFTLGGAFSDALFAYAEWLLQNPNASQHKGVEWRKVLRALTSDAKDALLGKTQQLLLQECGQSIESVLPVYGEFLSDSQTAAEAGLQDADHAFNERFLQILNRENAIELRWLAQVIGDRPHLESEVSDAYWNAFGERVEETWKDSRGPVRDALADVAEGVGITLPEPEEKNIRDT